MLVALALGLPSIVATPERIIFRLLTKTSCAEWSSLSDFAEKMIYPGSGYRKKPFAVAKIVGPNVSPNILRSKWLRFGNYFEIPITELVDELLNAMRARCPKVQPLAPVPQPREADETRFGLIAFKAPWLTFALLAVLIAVFVAEQVFAIGTRGPLLRVNVATLLALGGVDRVAVLENGEWYRLFTAPLLHLSIDHLVLNAIALLMAGYMLERLVGRAWFLAFFVVGALGGALMSLTLNQPTLTSVGASGAIMGLLAGTFVGSFRMPSDTRTRTRLQTRSLGMLIPSLLPLATTATGATIDYAAHLGGALSCGILAFFLIKTWPDTARLPRFREFAVSVSAAGTILAGLAAFSVAVHHRDYSMLAVLIPQNDLSKNDVEIPLKAATLLAQYPQDPRSHLYQGISLMKTEDYGEAERELRSGLPAAERFRTFFGPQLAIAIRADLAGALHDEGRIGDARDIARSICEESHGDAFVEKVRSVLTAAQICR